MIKRARCCLTGHKFEPLEDSQFGFKVVCVRCFGAYKSRNRWWA